LTWEEGIEHADYYGFRTRKTLIGTGGDWRARASLPWSGLCVSRSGSCKVSLRRGPPCARMPAQLAYLLSGIDWRHPQETWRPTSVG